MPNPIPEGEERAEQRWDALVNHPQWGSLWLENARIVGGSVVGTVYEEAPDGYHRMPMTMNFPATCIRKREAHA